MVEFEEDANPETCQDICFKFNHFLNIPHFIDYPNIKRLIKIFLLVIIYPHNFFNILACRFQSVKNY